MIAVHLTVTGAAEGRELDAASGEPFSVVIVPGAAVRETGKPSDILSDRLLTALELYWSGRVEKFLLSGDHGRAEYDEVNPMRRFLLAHDVPPEDIFLDHAGFDTYDTMYRARHVFQVERALVVTQDFHLPRAIYLARAVGIDAYGVPADRQPYVKIDSFKRREWLAQAKAVLDVWFGSKPTYVGDVIPMAGDGRVTWDEE
ncbi:YdcF family protein [Candidatus Uhrbacteria bacterium]|nr:YdcF family protein [Candidatus Uhrbacteria bacterium]